MMRLTEAAQALKISAYRGDVSFSSVSIDTRTLQRGALYIALRGPRFDGHDFVRFALENGASAVMIDAAYQAQASALTDAVPRLVVEDTRLGLGQLAAAWRNRFDIPIVAVTGSNGKTTVKEMLAAILTVATGNADAVLATQGNLNNDIGVPLTLLGLRASHRFAVLEMGMNHLGEIDYLTRLATPTLALVNNAQNAHVGELGNLENIAHAKGEIFAGLRREGIAVINADDAYAAYWRALNAQRRVVDFGLDPTAQVSGRYELLRDSVRLEIRCPTQTLQVHVPVPGLHNVRNALAATAAALALHIAPQAIAQGLSAFHGVKGRLQAQTVLHGATLIDDTYNANPDSVCAAIDVLAQAPGEKILVLGDMGELGADAAQLHAEVGRYAQQKGIDALFCLGDLSRHSAQAFGTGAWHFERIQELLADLENRLSPTVSVLVKGSRFMQMERVVRSFEIA